MPKYTSLSDIQRTLHEGETTCRALVEYYLSQIEQTRHLNAYVEVWAEEALEKAGELDTRFKENPDSVGRLFGAVISLKDNICYAGHQVTAASKILEGFTSLYSATAVERLLAEDAIIIGRTNCDQFGMGSSNENSVYGPVRNAADPERVSGGSSGGAAVSVQTDTCLAALGSDTGGSVRQPAAFCGIWGFKPTYGRISRHGLIAYGSSFDQIGVMANNPSDIAALLDVMQGPDEFDSTTIQCPMSNVQFPISNIRIGYFPEAIENEGLDAGVRSVTWRFIEQLRAAGHVVAPIAFDLLDFIIPTYYILTTAEASSNLARYDGIRYGRRSPRATNLEETYLLSRSEGFSEEVKRRILLGTFVLSSGYYDAYYNKAQRARALIRKKTLGVLSGFDFILMPVAPTTAWRFGEKSDDPVAMYLSDIYTVLANLAGIPALAVPAGHHPENDLPVGIQLMAAPWEDAKLLEFAQQALRLAD
ncbi:MAG: Asp-tRNA(Asn)/Glu-tRNA(Gln) amidotransferase subunit GatA [Haliscomenobacteraceae bacterium CHB4]|nr:Asp-tRNA(Asn)/Glu-tRNA(Gln) amidotransferase subunit GatA [Haliscomenobacteraceae bacterium CHB4]